MGKIATLNAYLSYCVEQSLIQLTAIFIGKTTKIIYLCVSQNIYVIISLEINKHILVYNVFIGMSARDLCMVVCDTRCSSIMVFKYSVSKCCSGALEVSRKSTMTKINYKILIFCFSYFNLHLSNNNDHLS